MRRAAAFGLTLLLLCVHDISWFSRQLNAAQSTADLDETDNSSSTVKMLQPNETGQIMVLMYHRIGSRESMWMRSRRNFRNDLKILYQNGYRPISLLDLVHNRIGTKAGYTPIVLTFDDGHRDVFNVIERDDRPEVDPECALGILEEFHREHPDFPLEATFFLHGPNPFRQSKWLSFKLNYLISKGLDIGNHTVGHNNLTLKQNNYASKIQRFIGGQAQFLERMITEHPEYRINTYALCNGQRPKTASLRKYLVNGEYKSRPYSNVAILNVGSGPVPSPVARQFNPLSIPRIRASNVKSGNLGFSSWLNYFKRRPQNRYVSDGDPTVTTVPRHLSSKVESAKLRGSVLKIYD
ncbi:MAG: polysaccharide deacetylase family protein [Proteobacteria bacterium]|nr:polysaccharide deacetylase family protein [Pseudomonadota bacterium]